MIVRRDDAEIERIDAACGVVCTVLAELGAMVRPGVTTGELDAHAERRISEMGAKPAFKGYRGFPATLCISIDDEVVHGIPGERPLEEGELVSIDCGSLLKGYYGDSAITVEVGEVSEEKRRLSKITRECLMLAIEEVVPGRRIKDLGRAVEGHARKHGFGVVEEFCGHGIGTRLHEDPEVPNLARRGRSPRIEEGMVLAIEPMITAGKPGVKTLGDGWTAVTRDRSAAAHWELVAVATKNGPRVLGNPKWPAKE